MKDMKAKRFFALIALFLALVMLFCACGTPETGAQDPSASETPSTPEDPSTPENPSTPEDPSTPSVTYGSFDEDNIMLTFAALSDTHVTDAGRGNKMANMMKKLADLYQLDAFVFAGDMTDKINGTASQYNEASFKVGYTELAHFAECAVAGNEDLLPIVWCMGNHERPDTAQSNAVSFSASKSYTFSGGSMLDAAYHIFAQNDPDGYMFMQATDGAPTGFRYTEIAGVSFFAVDYRYVDEASAAWLDERLAALEANDRSQPIFVVSHMPSNNKDQPKLLTQVLQKHNNVFYLSGHTHTPMQCGSAFRINEGFTEVVIGPGNHANYGVSGPGYTYCNYSMKQSAVFEVDMDGNVRVTALDLSFHVKEDGSITELIYLKGYTKQYEIAENPLVVREAIFLRPLEGGRYERAEDTACPSVNDPAYKAPVLAADALTVTEATERKLTLSLAKAAACNVIRYYEITVSYSDGEARNVYDSLASKSVAVLKIPSDYILYGTHENYPDPFTLTVRPCAEAESDVFYRSESFTVSVTAYDDFGTASNTVTVPFNTNK